MLLWSLTKTPHLLNFAAVTCTFEKISKNSRQGQHQDGFLLHVSLEGLWLKVLCLGLQPGCFFFFFKFDFYIWRKRHILSRHFSKGNIQPYEKVLTTIKEMQIKVKWAASSHLVTWWLLSEGQEVASIDQNVGKGAWVHYWQKHRLVPLLWRRTHWLLKKLIKCHHVTRQSSSWTHTRGQKVSTFCGTGALWSRQLLAKQGYGNNGDFRWW